MLDREKLAADLEIGLHNGDVYALFQPLIDVSSGRIVGAEGLCRWTHSHGFAVPPDMFMPLAEASGLIHELGRFMLDQCLSAVGGWRAGGSVIDVSVNVSPTQLMDLSFAGLLIEQLTARALALSAVTIEITESVPVRDLERILPGLERLRERGVGVSLDDYGTGHASPDQLDRLPLTEVKLDRSLIRDGHAGVTGSLRDVVSRAHERDLRVVAEGIETAEQMSFVQDLGADRAQGYLLGAPMPKTQLDALLNV